MPYQTFDDQKGDSDSFAKLQRLNLPSDLTNQSVLDIGCNEGFFCRAAVDRGAKRVVGLDRDRGFIARAKLRVPEASFIRSSWLELPNEQFDLVLFLSAMHYLTDPRVVLDNIAARLNNNGLLILECGAIPDAETAYWASVERTPTETLRYPSLRLLQVELLSKFATELVGRSITQEGDPVPRFVFHCRRLAS